MHVEMYFLIYVFQIIAASYFCPSQNAAVSSEFSCSVHQTNQRWHKTPVSAFLHGLSFKFSLYFRTPLITYKVLI